MSEILIAPLSHNPLRDWPADHYRDLIRLLLERLEGEVCISLAGSPNQRLTVSEIVRPFPADRVSNMCGLAWEKVVRRIQGALCVIGNNSGIAHLAGHFGVPTVCIFGGSHQRTEWAPLQPNVVVLSREIGCSPCQFHRVEDCRYGTACLREITPEVVMQAVIAAMRQHETISRGEAA
jgi:ADP-heptose:LPS heptosyltransferase